MDAFAEQRPTTLVTALFDVAGRERSSVRRGIPEYLDFGAFLLRQQRPLVCVCDPEIAPVVSSTRARLGLAALTLVIARPLEETGAYALLGQIASARRARPIENADRDKDTPLYTICTWEKFAIIEEVARTNPFGSDTIAWVDFGISHVARCDHADCDRVFEAHGERVSILQLCPWRPGLGRDLREYASFVRGYVAGGFLAGSRDSMTEMARRVRGTIGRALSLGIAMTDEQALAIAVDDHPGLFAPYPGDYDCILSNARVLREGGSNLRLQLSECLRLRDWQWAAEIGRAVRDGLDAGTFRCEPAELAGILESLVVAAWNAEYPRQDEAARIARRYANLVATSLPFREHFASRREEVVRRFAQLDVTIGFD